RLSLARQHNSPWKLASHAQATFPPGALPRQSATFEIPRMLLQDKRQADIGWSRTLSRDREACRPESRCTCGAEAGIPECCRNAQTGTLHS
ncbi:hypothetical protein WMY93_032249, partial [Mugilogobius chulae]